MRYIDTGAREPENALGFWLENNVFRDPTVRELRWQTGFFDANCLGYFGPLMERLRTSNGTLSVLIGSNEGMTPRADVEALLAAAGRPRKRQRIGIVRFSNGFFHPKTIHLRRADGSAAAYVGSANLTRNGVTSLHVEAGLLLDTHDNDDAGVLAEIAAAVDWWFAARRQGLNIVSKSADLQTLVAQGVLDVPTPPRPKPTSTARTVIGRATPLKPLLSVPALRPRVVAARPLRATPGVMLERWWKKLSRSDAQRKRIGNQRGSITLVRAGHSITAGSYFRRTFFKNAKWLSEKTNTGERRERTVVPFHVNLPGKSLGVLSVAITYAPNREAAQANYTSLLHLGPLAIYFGSQNFTGKYLELVRCADGRYSLSIMTTAP